jgi:ribonuclease BN (tRNA processing enzyme)
MPVKNCFARQSVCPESARNNISDATDASLLTQEGIHAANFLSIDGNSYYSQGSFADDAERPMTKVIVTTLGTGDAFGSFGRAHSGILIAGQHSRLLIDPGPAILPQMWKARLPASSIDAVLITHLDGDHIAGLPFLLLDYQFASRRKRRLVVVSPRGSTKRLLTLTTACYPDLSPNKLRFPVLHKEVGAGDKFTLSGARVSGFAMNHNRAALCLGYRIRIGGKTIAVTGDTGWCDALVKLSDGADLLLTECTNYSTEMPGHLNYLQIAGHRRELNARRIVLTHVGGELLRNARRVRLPIARDGGKIVL